MFSSRHTPFEGFRSHFEAPANRPATSVATLLATPFGQPYYRRADSPWPQGRDDRPGKSMAEARNELRNQVNLLRRHAHVPGAKRIADRLRRCTSRHPCTLGACPACDLARQRLIVDATNRFILAHPVDLMLVTCIDTTDTLRRGQLGERPLFGGVRPRLHWVLHRHSVRAIGGLEFSYNVAENRWHDDRWIEQAHIIIPRAGVARLREPLREAFPVTNGVKRPVRFDRFDGSPRGIAYATKNRTLLRVQLNRTCDADTGGTRHSTRWKPLRSAERVELTIAQARAGLDASVFLHGFHLEVRQGRVHLALDR